MSLLDDEDLKLENLDKNIIDSLSPGRVNECGEVSGQINSNRADQGIHIYTVTGETCRLLYELLPKSAELRSRWGYRLLYLLDYDLVYHSGNFYKNPGYKNPGAATSLKVNVSNQYNDIKDDIIDRVIN